MMIDKKFNYNFLIFFSNKNDIILLYKKKLSRVYANDEGIVLESS